ncbi:beta-carotene hydroxylase 2, chloroplastic [Selaginella moellendorffii]|nr:beta-carotene hydroxylase 2, chloroplastic [Selaginella moellendorffii]|eukprot:XP_002985535.2 beta-carotene hydroxylase 2, chloroplastic [Selaginella moellendorffii]
MALVPCSSFIPRGLLSLPPLRKSLRRPKSKAIVLGASMSEDGQSRTCKKQDATKKKKAERTTYLFAAVASSTLIGGLSIGAACYRFVWQMQEKGSSELPALEILGTVSLALGAAVGMEFWARWAHKALWHSCLWSMHKSHHLPRQGPFEVNDVFAIVNAVPAIALMSYGFSHEGLLPGLCFGAGLGITIFGMAYMFVHDGLVHQRFSVGPLADVPYFRKVAAAHQIHHANLFDGVPYGLFLGLKELEAVGGELELEKLVSSRHHKK